MPELGHRAKYWQSRMQQTMDLHTYLRNFPDAQGRFGEYGGVYLPDELVPAFEEITEAYQTIAHSAQFINEPVSYTHLDVYKRQLKKLTRQPSLRKQPPLPWRKSFLRKMFQRRLPQKPDAFPEFPRHTVRRIILILRTLFCRRKGNQQDFTYDQYNNGNRS